MIGMDGLSVTMDYVKITQLNGLSTLAIAPCKCTMAVRASMDWAEWGLV